MTSFALQINSSSLNSKCGLSPTHYVSHAKERSRFLFVCILTEHTIHVATACYVMHKELYSHGGMVAVALNLLRFNSLGWSVTPTFFG